MKMPIIVHIVINVPRDGGIWKLISREGMGGTGQPIPKMPIVPLQSPDKPVSWLGYPRSRPPNNTFSVTNEHAPDLQRYH
jgi:hypothetical protein